MTIFGDKLLGSVLPTRDGPAQGHGAERVMMGAVGGPDGIRTRIVSNPDGTTTMLRTRNGMPEFSTSGQKGGNQTDATYERGFVARVQTKAFGALFSPYTLAVSNPNYKLINITYTVLPFASTHNVAYTDTTHWYDVLTFQGNMIRVNGKKMPALVMGGFVPGAKAIPWLIPLPPTPYTGLARYGDKATNATTKRVFSVRRDEVKSFGGGGTTQTLTPTTPRTAGKAMTIGPRIDPATNKAYLGQLFYTADAWDDSGAEWGFSAAEVAMLLTAPYLTKVSSGPSVPMAPPALTDQGTSSGTMSTATTLPAVEWGMSATGGYTENHNYTSIGSELITLFWTYSGIFADTMAGAVDASYNRHTYGGNETASAYYAGTELIYGAVNTINFDVRNETTKYNTTTFTYPVGAHYNDTGDDHLNQSVSSLSMESGYTPGTIPLYRGKTAKLATGGSIVNSSVTGRNYAEQAGSFYVRKGSDDLVSVVFSRYKSSGPKALIRANTGYYDIYMGNNPYSGGVGMGLGANRRILTGGERSYKNTFPYNWATQPPGAQSEIVDFAFAMADSYAAQIYFDDETSSGIGRTRDGSKTDYYHSDIGYPTSDASALTWSSKDYLLYDDINGVFISVEGSFIGANTSATLTVLLRVKTRLHEVVTTLSVFTYTGQVLPETLELVEGSGTWVVPSPQIRAIFAPLYCEQGTFKGAHYVTLAEETNGATPFHGFNFVLRLKMYGDLATLNQQNDVNTEIGFIPCNLLEMLYAFVFSQAYGVAETGERYPIWYPSRFTAMRDGLFTNPIRVNIRNGVNADWLDTLGAPYIDDTTTELYRT